MTLIELLVVISVVAVLTGILLPALGLAHKQARRLVSVRNMRAVVHAVNFYASDNAGLYPMSVATIGFGKHWNWQEPTMLVGYCKRSPHLRRSMSSYLRPYISDATVLFCPNAPQRYPYLQDAWDAGESWDHPLTGPVPDPVFGTYCFYWNYVGYLPASQTVFKGPHGPVGGPGQSRLLISDYFGYDHWRCRGRYASCEPFKDAQVVKGTEVSSALWSARGCGRLVGDLAIQLQAGYIDGHVHRCDYREVTRMRVSLRPDGTVPYPSGVGPGDFFIPMDY